MNQKIDFYRLLWEFGEFVSKETEQIPNFAIDYMITDFITHKMVCFKRDQNTTDNEKKLSNHECVLKNYLGLVCSLFKQNCAFVVPHPTKKTKEQKDCKHTQETHVQRRKENSVSCPTTFFQIASNWKHLFSRKIITLQEPQTREDLVKLTHFSRQRVCTILAIYKCLNLIIDKSKHYPVIWNYEQSQIFTNLNILTKDILQIISLKEQLVKRLLLILKLLKSRVLKSKAIGEINNHNNLYQERRNIQSFNESQEQRVTQFPQNNNIPEKNEIRRLFDLEKKIFSFHNKNQQQISEFNKNFLLNNLFKTKELLKQKQRLVKELILKRKKYFSQLRKEQEKQMLKYNLKIESKYLYNFSNCKNQKKTRNGKSDKKKKKKKIKEKEKEKKQKKEKERKKEKEKEKKKKMKIKKKKKKKIVTKLLKKQKNNFDQKKKHIVLNNSQKVNSKNNFDIFTTDNDINTNTTINYNNNNNNLYTNNQDSMIQNSMTQKEMEAAEAILTLFPVEKQNNSKNQKEKIKYKKKEKLSKSQNILKRKKKKKNEIKNKIQLKDLYHFYFSGSELIPQMKNKKN
ncbi:scratch family transcriptional repressor 1-related [Anaeramoeba flamelloides]|uniref:Scratch family transcriptional repressor 1-related n=1 Tax=Anaeramoeba flamelloides TaxID=1746091 RepID=A0ABQ8X3A0_9EUKA|nr:scratch family transcriptional repressor 1-related [Anaeramoeba flamelloides]